MRAKEFLSPHGIEIEEKDITQDQEAVVELVESYQSWATPTLVIDGEVVIGFDRARLE